MSTRFQNPQSPILLKQKSSSSRQNSVEGDIYTDLNLLDDDVQAVTVTAGNAVLKSGTNNMAGNYNVTGVLNLARGSDPTAAAGNIHYNTVTGKYVVYDSISGAVKNLALEGSLDTGEIRGGCPTWASVSSISVPAFSVRDSTDTLNLTKLTSTTLSTATLGLNGIFQTPSQTANLSGTAGTGGISSVNVVGVGSTFLSDFQKGDIFWTASGSAVVASVTSNLALVLNTALTIAAGTNYRRGDLVGTVGTGGAPTTTITGVGTTFLTSFQIGDVIWTAVGAARITNIATNLSLTVANNLTIANGTVYRRGGLAINTVYWLLFTAKPDGSLPGCGWTTRNPANGTDLIVDLPQGYLNYRQIRYNNLTDGSSNIFNVSVGEGWPYRPRIQYNTYMPGNVNTGTTQVLSSGGAIAFTDLYLPYVPANSKLAWLSAVLQAGALCEAGVRQKGVSHNGTSLSAAINTVYIKELFPIETDASQFVQYVQTAAGAFVLHVQGYVLTEMNN